MAQHTRLLTTQDRRLAAAVLRKPFAVDRLLAALRASPVGPHTPRQCAWCGWVRGPDGQYRSRPLARITAATHGICAPCKAAEYAELDGG
jgi:hypothetical protein